MWLPDSVEGKMISKYFFPRCGFRLFVSNHVCPWRMYGWTWCNGSVFELVGVSKQVSALGSPLWGALNRRVSGGTVLTLDTPSPSNPWSSRGTWRRQCLIVDCLTEDPAERPGCRMCSSRGRGLDSGVKMNPSRWGAQFSRRGDFPSEN